MDSKSFLNAVSIFSFTLPNSNPTFLLSSVAPLSLFNISSTCFADNKAFASKVSKNALSFFVVVSNPPLVASSSFLYSFIGFLSLLLYQLIDCFDLIF